MRTTLFNYFLVVFCLMAGTVRTHATTYTVNSTADPGTGTGTSGSLRYCITQANSVAGPHTIQFNASGTGTITLGSALPAIQQNIFIDGSTATGYSTWNPKVVLSGNGLDIVVAGAAGTKVLGISIINTGANGITVNGVNTVTIQDCFIGTDGTSDLGTAAIGVVIINSTGSSVRHCLLSGNNAHGLFVQSSPSTIVSGNYVGTNKGGTAVIANSAHGILFQDNCAGSKIGGITSDSLNLVSGNGAFGIFLLGSIGNNIRIVGNYVGLNAAGTAALGVQQYGINDQSNAGSINGLYILKNVVSGCSVEGITIGSCSNVVIKGNYLGTNAAGSATIANFDNSIELRSTNGAIIGGSTVAERNVFGGSGASGKHALILQSVTNNCVIKGNYIGTNASGTAITGGGIKGYGIVVKGNSNIIGGVAAGERNIISGVAEVGILITDGSSNQIVGNYIGVDASLNALGNGFAGVLVRQETGLAVQNNIITNNVIAYNGYTYPTNPSNSTWIQPNKGPGVGIGVAEYGTSNTGAIQNKIRDNQIYCNAGLGISLNRNETTPGYGNINKAAPVINSGTSTNTDTYGTALPGDEIQVFGNPTNCGTCQGEVLLGTVIADGAGNWSLLGHASYYKGKITAYGKDASNNTSEFSICTDPTLPVQWTSFTATKQGNQEVLLEWTVATQINNHYFTVEKSDDGIHFYDLEQIEGDGSLPVAKSYHAYDMHFTQNAYYRLKQTDFDGNTSYSIIRFVAYQNASLSIFPNPANDWINLNMSVADHSSVELTMTNALSQVVAYYKWEGVAGNLSKQLDVSALPAGVYIATVTVTGQPLQMVKIILE